VRYYCSLFGRSRQGWYEHQAYRDEQDLADTMVLKLVEEIRHELPRAGVPQLQVLLKPKLLEHQIKIGRDGLYRLLGEHGYLLRYRRRKPYTTDSNHPFTKYPNLIGDIGYLTGAGQLWVSDITYLRLQKKFCYLSIVTDAYSHKIIGHCLHPSLHSDGAIRALLTALQSKRSPSLIHHSDRGIQYCCREYVTILNQYHIRISMAEAGDPYQNAIAERVNGILKTEFLLSKTFATFEEADNAVKQAISNYNHLRPHQSCDNLTPVIAHDQHGWLRKRWKPLSNQPVIT